MPRKELPTRKPPPYLTSPSWVACGFDISMTVVAGACLAFDSKLDRMLGPSFVEKRWTKDTHLYDRIKDAAYGHELVMELIHGAQAFPKDVDQVFIGIEQAVPFGMLSGRGKFTAAYAAQALEIHGSFKGALLRWGYKNVVDVNNATWQSLCCRETSTPFKERNKFVSKKWALQAFGNAVPDWPDIVETANGAAPRPAEGKGAKAAALWADDRYDGLAVCAVIQESIEAGELRV